MKIAEFDLLESSSSRDELIAQIRLLNDRRSDYPRDRTVHQVFQDRAHHWPGAIAVVDGSETWSYRELDSASNRMARFLLTRCFPPGPVAGSFPAAPTPAPRAGPARGSPGGSPPTPPPPAQVHPPTPPPPPLR